jgi:hypothetical protein
VNAGARAGAIIPGGVMTRQHLLWFIWSARILGIGVAVFLGLFALDAFAEGKPLGQALVDFAIHLLPSAVVLVIVALAWRWAWVGGVVFVSLAVAYAVMVGFRMAWVVAISVPLLLVGLLFLWSWLGQHKLHAA